MKLLQTFALFSSLTAIIWQIPTTTTFAGTNILTSNRETNLGNNKLIIAQAQQNRVALIIGNSNYEDGKLNNPVNDAKDMAEALKSLGFQVILLLDANQQQMGIAIENLGRKLKQNGGVGLFYFAGHGMQVKGENYLFPVSAKVNREQDIPYQTIPVGQILGIMEDAGNTTNIVILDSCRNNPYARQWRSNTQGLAPVQTAVGTFISYATSPGNVASDGSQSNGLYTFHILKHIKTPTISIEEMFKRVRAGVIQESNKQQLPWESSSLIGSFTFNPSNSQTPVTVVNSNPTNPKVDLPHINLVPSNHQPPPTINLTPPEKPKLPPSSIPIAKKREYDFVYRLDGQPIPAFIKAKLRSLLASNKMQEADCNNAEVTITVNEQFVVCAMPSAKYESGNYSIDINGLE